MSNPLEEYRTHQMLEGRIAVLEVEVARLHQELRESEKERLQSERMCWVCEAELKASNSKLEGV